MIDIDMTPEEMAEMSTTWKTTLVSLMSLEERLIGVQPEDIMPYYAPEDRLAGMKKEEIEAYLQKM